MAHDQHGAFVIGDDLLQQVERLEVEVVGRFVEYQQVGRLGELASQQQSAAFAARQHADAHVDDLRIEQEVLEIGLHVLAIAAHVDPVAALGEHLPHCLVGGKQLALLVDHHSGQRLGDLDAAAVGFEFARQHLEQRGLARAIGADDADPVATLDAQAERLDDRPVAIGLADVVRGNDRLRLEVFLCRELEFRRAASRYHRGALRAHLPQLLESALVALAPRGHAAFEPVRFQFELGVELLRRACFLGVDLLFPRLVAAEADFLASQIAAIEPQRRTRQALEERPVVADHDEGAAITLKPAFKPVDRAKVEMVGRLVHQQQVGVLRQRACDRCAALLAPACALGPARHLDAELPGDRFDLVLLRGVLARQCPIHQRCMAGEIGILFEQHHSQRGLGLALPGIGFDAAVDHAE